MSAAEKMEFTQEDIKKLYGTHFFMIPEEATAEEETETVEEEPNSEAIEVVAQVPEPEKRELETPVEESQSPYNKYFTEGETVAWKMKPNTQLVLIIQESEYRNRELTGNLKLHIIDAGIPTDNIGFGVIPDGTATVNCSNMKPKVAMIFKLFPEKLPSPVELDGKYLFAVADLAMIKSKSAFQKRLIQLLQQAYQLTQS